MQENDLAKESIVSEILALKQEKRKGWEQRVRSLCRKLEAFDSRFDDIEFSGGESVGRKLRSVRILPIEEPFDDDVPEQDSSIIYPTIALDAGEPKKPKKKHPRKKREKSLRLRFEEFISGWPGECQNWISQSNGITRSSFQEIDSVWLELKNQTSTRWATTQLSSMGFERISAGVWTRERNGKMDHAIFYPSKTGMPYFFLKCSS